MKPKSASFKATPKKKVVSKRGKNPSTEYDLDFSKWIQHQIGFLKKGELEKVDIAHLIEEMESLGRSDKKALCSQTSRLLSSR
jgi:hypothetical protein